MNYPAVMIDLDLELKALSYLISDSTNFFGLEDVDFNNHLHQKLFREIRSGFVATYTGLLSLGLPENSINMLFELSIYTSRDMEIASNQLRGLSMARKKLWNNAKEAQILSKSTPSELAKIVGVKDVKEHTFTPQKTRQKIKNMDLPREIYFEPASINEVIRNFNTGWVSIIASSTGVGKTSTAIQLSRSIAENEQSISLYVSLEMPIESYLERCLSIAYYREYPESDYVTWLDYLKTMSDDAYRDDYNKYSVHENEIIMDMPGMSVMAIKEQARKIISQGINLKTVVIDHLYLVRPSQNSKSENENMAAVINEIDAMAKELNVRVLLVCQTRKGNEDGRFEEPILEDIRGSKAIPEIAWWALVLWRDKVNSNILNWKVAKKRQGEGVGRSGKLNLRGTYMYDDTLHFDNPNF
jgi:replicative DNA helicase